MSCGENSGFLFKHPCSQQAAGQCQTCTKAVCVHHTHPTPQGYMCTTCAKKIVKQARFQGKQWQGWDDDPYLYDTYYYTGYGYYGRGYWGHEIYAEDFTEADGDALGQGDADWEYDMRGS